MHTLVPAVRWSRVVMLLRTQKVGPCNRLCAACGLIKISRGLPGSEDRKQVIPLSYSNTVSKSPSPCPSWHEPLVALQGLDILFAEAGETAANLRDLGTGCDTPVRAFSEFGALLLPATTIQTSKKSPWHKRSNC